MNTPKLQIETVSKVWSSRDRMVTAIEDMSFEVSDQEFLCLLGPSGCGKSTMLEMLAGLEAPTAGQILLDGEPIRGPDPKRGMVFQSHALFPWRTVRENIEFGPEMRGTERVARREQASELIELVGLQGFEAALPREISGGMAQRVAVARALANEPEVLLMDEPFGALDAQTREELQGEITRIWRETLTTVVFVTHSVQEAVLLGDRIIVMASHPGRLAHSVDVELPRPRDVTSHEVGDAMSVVYDCLSEVRGRPGRNAGA